MKKAANRLVFNMDIFPIDQKTTLWEEDALVWDSTSPTFFLLFICGTVYGKHGQLKATAVVAEWS